MRRAISVVATIVVALGGAILLLLWFEGRDDSQVNQQQGGAATIVGPGRLLPDQGDAHLRPGERPAQAYATDPPASGAHVPVAVVHDAARVSDDELLHALELGDVVLVYGSARPPAALRALADKVSGPFDPALAAAGQAVVLARRPGTRGVIALAWRHELRTPSASDPALEPFADFWLGRGAAA
jgi:Protein of unknown function (DUF3105)